ncbi:MAG: UvrD-helicase domain-containing protein [Clostridia bacterium]|nr:UvrD-helicase domain-containing protein [Clostridia bacterium]
MAQTERKWTTAQWNAITARDRTLLVSAAAGSGKTAVLTQRIIGRLTDPESPLDISRLLIVTFTKAAAAELKERITAAISRASDADPGNVHLKRQLHNLPRAQISTIDSFCYKLVKANFELLGVSANAAVIGDYDARVMSGEIMEELIEDCYEGRMDVGDFTALIDNFTTLRDDRAAESFASYYEKLRTFREGINLIQKSADMHESVTPDTLMSSPWGSHMREHLLRLTEHYIPIFRDSIEALDATPHGKYRPALEDDLHFLSQLASLAEQGSYDEISTALTAFQPMRLPSVREAAVGAAAIAKTVRDQYKDDIKKLRETYFSAPSDFLCTLEHRSAEICRSFYRFLAEYDKRYTARKRSVNKLDFADVERLALSLLWDGDEKTECAVSLAESFDEIYIDEYQDINDIQDAIFTAVSRENNRFMVGDIKQSIYGFRGSDPSIFYRYRDSFLPLGSDEKSDHATVFLSNNFRCDRNVIDFTNLIFGSLFTNSSGAMQYHSEDALIYSKTADDGDGKPVKVVLIQRDGDTSDSSEDTLEAFEEKSEARYVATEIKRLVESGYKKSDITILMRSTKSSAFEYERALTTLGIESRNEVLKSLFESSEVLLMLCILNCIDNPMRDIYLAGALRSPLYGFTLDDLIRIRKHLPGVSLYEALCRYTEECNFGKGEYFLKKLASYRRYARGCPCDKLIWYLICDTAMEALVYKENNDDSTPEIRRANLMLLYEYSRSFEIGAFKGLYNFICYLEEIIGSGATLGNAKNSGGEQDCVRIMTVHQSKGLEFKVCFLCEGAKKFNRSDMKERYALDRGTGLSMKVRSEDGMVLYDTFSRRAAVTKLFDAQTDEEMRVLYVALTRAREKLYITASGDIDKLTEKSEMAGRILSYHVLSSKCASPIEWMLAVLLHHPHDCFEIEEVDYMGRLIAQHARSEENAREMSNLDEGEIAALIEKRFSFSYPNEASMAIPSKLTVSALHPRVLDDPDDAEAVIFPEEENDKKISPVRASPRFLSEEPEAQTAAQRGTATHEFMQFCDFDRVERDGVDAEIERLEKEEFIPKNAGKLIYRRDLVRFFRSPLYEEMKHARQIWREIRFNIKMPASEFTEQDTLKSSLDGEYIFVQGVIDCVFIRDDGSCKLIDYKTDFVTDDEAGRAELVARHARQLSYYRRACKKLLCREVDETAIYAFRLGCEVFVPHEKIIESAQS